jgi:hypothetical protein
MRIYFTSSYTYANENYTLLEEIISKVKAEGNIITKRLFKPDDETTLNKEVGRVFDFSNVDLQQTHKNLIRRIREADIVVAEVTNPSNSIGYEIATAQAEKKPILVIFNSNKTERLANFFQGNDSKLFQVSPYKNADEAVAAIKQFVNAARDMIDTKFILIISPEIDRYLEWTAEERRMHKAQVVRNAIEDMMAKDKDYKQYTKGTVESA